MGTTDGCGACLGMGILGAGGGLMVCRSCVGTAGIAEKIRCMASVTVWPTLAAASGLGAGGIGGEATAIWDRWGILNTSKNEIRPASGFFMVGMCRARADVCG